MAMERSQSDPEALLMNLNQILASPSLMKHRIQLSQMRMTDEIGRGGYGIVYRALLGRQTVAVKVLRLDGDRRERIHVGVAFAREARLWADMDHPNILPLIAFHVEFGLDSTPERALFLSPYMAFGDITEYIADAKPDLLRRLELRNILIDHNGPRAVLCDFGLAAFVESVPSGLTTSHFDERGTPRYKSPELIMIENAKRTLQSDIWAWACLLFEIITDEAPYSASTNHANLILRIAKGETPGSLTNPALNPQMRKLLKACWQTQPERRPTIDACLESLAAVRAGVSPSVEEEPVPNRRRSSLQSITKLGSPPRKFQFHVAEAATIAMHESLYSVALSQNGLRVAAVSEKYIRIHDLNNGQELCSLGRIGGGQRVCMSPDGRLLADSRKTTLLVWDLDTQQIQVVFSGHTRDITSIAYAPNATYLVSGSWDETIRIWYPDRRERDFKLSAGATADHITVSPNSLYIATAHKSGLIKVWNVDKGSLVGTYAGHSSDIKTLQFSVNNRKLIGGDESGEIRCWDTGSVSSHGQGLLNRLISTVKAGVGASPAKKCKVHQLQVKSLAITPNGAWATSGSSDDEVKVVDVNGEQTYAIGKIPGLEEILHTEATNNRIVGLAAGKEDRKLTIWRYEVDM
ncbi:hypothetical protein FRB99_004968 [Tulasnella sp. 403]|nr:hypothetical protein FRB99_004968 [Tulasnella sp. 403]